MRTIRVFASHDWGLGARTHARVRTIVEALRARGICVWFDETHMKGNILDAMCRGIDASDVILVFITSNYVTKVQSGDDRDNVRREFMYAQSTPHKLLAVRLEPRVKCTGPVGMILGSSLYVDMSKGDDVDELARTIRHRTAGTLWARAGQCTRRATPVVTAQPRPCRGPPAKRLDAKERVARAIIALGCSVREREHAGESLDRILQSLCGNGPGSSPLPDCATFMEKLRHVETELDLSHISR